MRERFLWTSLELADPTGVHLTAPAGVGKYAVSLADHVTVVRDEETLFAGVLIQSYALAEYAAAYRLGADRRSFGGIEDWGSRLLANIGQSLADVLDDRPGAVEVTVVHNAFAHGTREIDQPGEARLKAADMHTRGATDPVSLTYEELRRCRDRLRSLLRMGAVA